MNDLAPEESPFCTMGMRSQNVISNRTSMGKTAITLAQRINSRILFLRGQKVILDSDLAELYGVEVRHLNQQVKRNLNRFPAEFRFQLSAKETEVLRSQIVISNNGRGGRRYLPYAFTEYGAIMAATVLNSERAIRMSIFVVRAFVHIREVLATNQHVVLKLAELERRLANHDIDIQGIGDHESHPPAHGGAES